MGIGVAGSRDGPASDMSEIVDVGVEGVEESGEIVLNSSSSTQVHDPVLSLRVEKDSKEWSVFLRS